MKILKFSFQSEVKNVLGPLTNYAFNRILEAVVPGMINDQQELINEVLQAEMIPIANSMVNQLTLLDMINLIAEIANRPIEVTC